MTTRAMLELMLRHQLIFDFSDDGFADVCWKLDLLHDAVRFGRLEAVTDLPMEVLRGWLREIMFLARETLYELDAEGGQALWN